MCTHCARAAVIVVVLYSYCSKPEMVAHSRGRTFFSPLRLVPARSFERISAQLPSHGPPPADLPLSRRGVHLTPRGVSSRSGRLTRRILCSTHRSLSARAALRPEGKKNASTHYCSPPRARAQRWSCEKSLRSPCGFICISPDDRGGVRRRESPAV